MTRIIGREAEIRARKAMMTVVTERTPVPWAMIDRAGRLEMVNAAFARLTGAPIARHRGRHLDDVLVDAAPTTHAELLADALRGHHREDVHVSVRIPEASRKMHELLESWHPVAADDDEVVGAALFVVEVTDRARDRRRLEQLQVTTAALSSAVRAEDVARVFLDRAVAAMGATAAAIAVIEDRSPHRTILRHRGFAATAADENFPAADDARPLMGLLSDENAQWLSDRDAVAAAYRPSGAPDRHARLEAMAVIPLRVGARHLGGLALGFDTSREFEPAERELLSTAATLFAHALDRAGLYDHQRRTAARQQFLARASMLFARAFEPEEILNELARLAVPRLADWCSVSVPERGSLINVAVAHSDPARMELARQYLDTYPSRPGDVTGPARVIATGQSQFIEHVTDEMIDAIPDADRRRLLRDLGLISVITVPLVARGPVLGTLTLLNSESGEYFTSDDLAFAEDLGRRAGRVLDNARLYAREREISDTLQSSLLPHSLPSIPNLEISARYVPIGEGSEVGGDLYDAFAIGDGLGYAFLVGDVCGKGPEAAALTTLARYTIRAEADRLVGPAALLGRLNTAILRQHGDDRFMTMVYLLAVPRPDGMAYTMANAGHPPALVVRADGHVDTVRPPGIIVGVFDDAAYEQVELDIGPGDLVVMFTDGVTESRSPSGEFFGLRRLKDLLAAHASRSAQEVVVAIENAVDDFRGKRPLTDDVALMVLRVHPDPVRPGRDSE